MSRYLYMHLSFCLWLSLIFTFNVYIKQVTRLVLRNTVEEKIVELQKKKMEMIHNTLENDAIGRVGGSTKLTFEELEFLFDL